MPKTPTEKQRTTRANKRDEGFVLKQIWVKPDWWPVVQELINKLKTS